MNPRLLRSQVVLDRDYAGTTATLRTVRTDVVRCLVDRGAGSDLQERAELVVSELASNAMQASPGVPYNVRLQIDADGALVMALANHSARRGPPPREEWGPSNVLAVSGRGLMIVDELADSVKIDLPEVGKVVVTATLR